MDDIDTSTGYLKRWLEWGIEPHQCHPKVVKALIEELLRERDRAIETEQKFAKMMSDMEIRNAKSRGQEPGKPAYKDGIRYSSPPQRPLGPDGFPQRGIV